MLQLCFFDDSGDAGLQPLTLTRPCCMLRTGILTIAEKWKYLLNPALTTWQVPGYMKGVYPTPEPAANKSCLWINGRFLPHHNVVDEILGLEIGEGLLFQDSLLAFHIDGKNSKHAIKTGDIPLTSGSIKLKQTTNVTMLSEPWQIFSENGAQIRSDLALPGFSHQSLDVSRFPKSWFENEEHIFAEGDVSIGAGAVIDASTGPVFLGKGATVMAGALIQGPVCIGRSATIKMGAKIYGDTTIGPFCKIGGELHNVVFMGYSNKAHDGFLGNSVIGEWCNLGADTNNSNLKNNYSPVRLTDFATGEEYDTGQQFCGTIMGDHSKTAINTMLNTGTICGVSSSIVSGTFPNKFIRSFRWISPSGESAYDLDKALETAAKVMARRGVNLTPAYRKMMEYISEEFN